MPVLKYKLYLHLFRGLEKQQTLPFFKNDYYFNDRVGQ